VTQKELCSFLSCRNRPASLLVAGSTRPASHSWPLLWAGLLPEPSVLFKQKSCLQQSTCWPLIDQYVLDSLPFLSAKLLQGLCAFQCLPAHACTARCAPPSQRCCTRVTAHLATAVACLGTPPSGFSIWTCTSLSESRLAPEQALQSRFPPVDIVGFPYHQSSLYPPRKPDTAGLIPVAIRQQPQHRLLLCCL
jgi:hypothetical protein